MPWDWAGFLTTANELAKFPVDQLVLGVSVVGLGIFPRVGLGRAVGLALGSKLFPFRLAAVSHRTTDVTALASKVKHLMLGRYIVVTGQTGVGKSAVVNTVLWRTSGVVRTTVFSTMGADEIVTTVLGKIARTCEFPYLDNRLNAARVRFFYDMLLPPPIVVLNVYERQSDNVYANVTGASQELSELGYRVVVNGSSYDLPKRLFRTYRETVFQMGPMTRDVMETVPEFRPIFDVLRRVNRVELVWTVCGGNPALIIGLEQAMKKVIRRQEETRPPDGGFVSESEHELADVVDAFCLEQVTKAVGRVLFLEIKHPELKELIEMFKTVDVVNEDVVRKKRFVRPNDDVFCEADASGSLVPADAATALVLRHGLGRRSTVEELHNLVAQVTAKE